MKTQLSKIAMAAGFLLLGCTELERDNPFDPDGVNYAGSGEPIGGGSSVEGDKSSSSAEDGGSSSSAAGNVEYETVKIGNQIWMKKNLDVVPATGNSACYGNQTSNCDIYGRLYDWSAAMALPSGCNTTDCVLLVNNPHRGICPEGWHIPTSDEWKALINAVGGSNVAGSKLKATEWWNNCGPAGKSYICEDAFKFAALPGGKFSEGSFYSVGYDGYWWSASEYNEYIDIIGSRAAFLSISYNYASPNNLNNHHEIKNFFFSVRCLKD